jgi:hypothetical protein
LNAELHAATVESIVNRPPSNRAGDDNLPAKPHRTADHPAYFDCGYFYKFHLNLTVAKDHAANFKFNAQRG